MMIKKIVTASVFLLLMVPAGSCSQSLDDPEVVDLFLVAKGFFEDIDNKNYTRVWDGITAKSQAKIIDAIYKEQKETGEYSTREQLKRDFDSCSSACKSFWTAYFKAFDPESTLNQSKWDLGYIKKKKAEIWITHIRADRPAKLKMFLVDGKWRVGLMESFWSRWTKK